MNAGTGRNDSEELRLQRPPLHFFFFLLLLLFQSNLSLIVCVICLVYILDKTQTLPYFTLYYVLSMTSRRNEEATCSPLIFPIPSPLSEASSLGMQVNQTRASHLAKFMRLACLSRTVHSPLTARKSLFGIPGTFFFFEILSVTPIHFIHSFSFTRLGFDFSFPLREALSTYFM